MVGKRKSIHATTDHDNQKDPAMEEYADNDDVASDVERKARKRRKKEQKRIKKEEKKQRRKISKGIEDASVHKTIADNDAVFFEKKVHLTISVMPAALKDPPGSVEKSLRKMILQYSDGIGGILLAFENVHIISDNPSFFVGTILNELPYIHYHIAIDALVFAPRTGCRMTGTVTETSFHSHVSLIVYHYFNACIAAEHLRDAGFEFDGVQLQWYRMDDEQQSPLTSEDQLEFVCEQLFESGGIISIEGKHPSLIQPIPGL